MIYPKVLSHDHYATKDRTIYLYLSSAYNASNSSRYRNTLIAISPLIITERGWLIAITISIISVQAVAIYCGNIAIRHLLVRNQKALVCSCTYSDESTLLEKLRQP